MSDESQDGIHPILGYREFEFDLPKALLSHLVRALDAIEVVPLDVHNVTPVPEAQGVYQLFLDGELVYIGKTDADAGLAQRLTRHSQKILHRRGLDPGRVAFRAIRIFVFTAVDLEAQLIRYYRADSERTWNGSGFGANDPGRKRDLSEPGAFDTTFPIDIDHDLDIDLSGTQSAAAVLATLKRHLPYTLRFQTAGGRSRQPHSELVGTMVTIPAGRHTSRTILMAVVQHLPPGWQATALAAVLILYRERSDDYPNGTVIARS